MCFQYCGEFITCPNLQAKIFLLQDSNILTFWVPVLGPNSKPHLPHPWLPRPHCSGTWLPFSGPPILTSVSFGVNFTIYQYMVLFKLREREKECTHKKQWPSQKGKTDTFHSFTKKWEIIDCRFFPSCKKQAAGNNDLEEYAERSLSIYDAFGFLVSYRQFY